MTDLLDILKQHVLVVDGAMGTQLFAAGLDAGGCAEEWNVSHAHDVQRIQGAYVEAGADVLLTNTFGGNRIALGRHGHEANVEPFNTAAVKNARAAGGANTLVFGDLGPTGAMPESLGGMGEDDFCAVFLQQAKALRKAGVDALIIETITSIEEMRGAVRAAKKAGAHAASAGERAASARELPVIASAAYDPTPDGTTFRTMMGVTVQDMTQAALDCGADVVGANCGGVNMRDMVAIAGTIRGMTSKPILIETNAGRPQLVGDKTVFPETPDEFAVHVGELLKLGVRLIGGCCGTTPAHIAALAGAVKRS
ncbi:MAG: homocysteine S-methyltransferase family protein [Verrucomicrobia bacterium]|nr:homocysteine S-methyltransferase family protein [Verrucomicrobiota bacterium]